MKLVHLVGFIIKKFIAACLSHTTVTVNGLSFEHTTFGVVDVPLSFTTTVLCDSNTHMYTNTHIQSNKHCVDFAHYSQQTSDKVFKRQQKFRHTIMTLRQHFDSKFRSVVTVIRQLIV